MLPYMCIIRRLISATGATAMAVATLLSASDLKAATREQHPVSGRVVDTTGAAVEFANVVLMRDSVQVRGLATDAGGWFRTTAAAGEYTITAQYLGYETAVMHVSIPQMSDCGDIVLQQQTMEMQAVVVTAPVVRREADRYIVDVGSAAAAIGRDGTELLKLAPGVWITGEEIQLNGNKNPKIFVNGIEQNFDTQQMMTYLRSLRAEDIQKIEVIPQSGADFDADSSSGVILITLKRQRENGMAGTLSLATMFGKRGQNYMPNLSLRYHRKRLDFYVTGWGWFADTKEETVETTTHANSDNRLESNSMINSKNYDGGGTTGVIYEISDKHSVGAAFEYLYIDEPASGIFRSDLSQSDGSTFSDSRYTSWEQRSNYLARLNYIYKIDSTGSTLKVLADYNHRNELSKNSNDQSLTTPSGHRDSLSNNRTGSNYDIVVMTVALEKRLSPTLTLQAGAKYTYNHMYHDARYDYRLGDQWLHNDKLSIRTGYNENIAALYAAVTAKHGKWGVTAGVRGEYTRTHEIGNRLDKRYFSLFPNVNISYQPADNHMLALQYSRTIARPRFWDLSPYRMQISDYLYVTGNPDLAPSYTNKTTLTYVFRQKYSLSASANIVRGHITQVIRQDPENPNIIIQTNDNCGKSDTYALNLNLPLTLAQWLTLNVDAVYGLTGNAVDRRQRNIWHHVVGTKAIMTVTLPREFMVDVSHSFRNRVYLADNTTSLNSNHNLSCSLKKQLFNKNMTLSASADNILGYSKIADARFGNMRRQVKMSHMWSSVRFVVRASWNFQSGKTFRQRAVETGAAEENSRM